MSKFPVIQIPVPSDRDFETHPEGAIAKYWQDLPSLGRSLVIDLVVTSRDCCRRRQAVRSIELASDRSSTTDEINTAPEELGRLSPSRPSS